MARKPNIAYDAKKLDDDIRKLDGERYSQANISKFIMGRGSTYYSQSFGKQEIAEDALDNVCKFYKLNKKDYLGVVKPVDSKAKPTQEVKHAVDLDGVLAGFDVLATKMDELLKSATEICKTLQAIESHSKSTNYHLEQVTDKLISIKKNEEETLKAIQQHESRYTGKNSVKRIGQ
ncbi:MAG: hypothetical protein IJE78_05695 [Bacteroidaceae bacterium]|nr:hypothetical protein [Bacteroidaceae bacterium]